MFAPITVLIGWRKYCAETPNVIMKGILMTSFIYLTIICSVPTSWAELLEYHSELNRLILSHVVWSLIWGGKFLLIVYKYNNEVDIDIGSIRRGLQFRVGECPESQNVLSRENNIYFENQRIKIKLVKLG